MLWVYLYVFQTEDSLCIDDFILEHIQKSPFWVIEVISELVSYINSEWVDIYIKKSKRRRTKKDKATWRIINLSNENYTWMNILDIVREDLSNVKSISVHDLIVNDSWMVSNKLLEGINQSMDEFVSWEKDLYWISFDYAKKLLYRRMFATIELFDIDDEENSVNDYKYPRNQISRHMFWKDITFPYIHMFFIFYRLKYIDLDTYNSSFIQDTYFHKESYLCSVVIKEPLLDMVKKHLLIDDYILNIIFDKKYKDLQIRWTNKWFSLSSTIEHRADEWSMVQLQGKYPHSDITVKTFKSKTQKYVVKEKKNFESIE